MTGALQASWETNDTADTAGMDSAMVARAPMARVRAFVLTPVRTGLVVSIDSDTFTPQLVGNG